MSEEAINPTLDAAVDPDDLIRRGLLPLRPPPAVPPISLSSMPSMVAPIGVPRLPAASSASPLVNMAPPLIPRPTPSAGAAPIISNPLSTTPRVTKPIDVTQAPGAPPITLPDLNNPMYRPLTGWKKGLAELSQLSPEEGIRNIGLSALAAPGERLKTATEAAKSGLEAEKTGAETELEKAEAAGKRAEIGKPKPVSEDKTVFTGPNNEKLIVQGYEVGGKTVYGVVGGGAPTADSPTNAQDALARHLSAQAAPTTPDVNAVPPGVGLPRPLGAGALPTVPVPTRPAASPIAGWTPGEPVVGERPAAPEDIQEQKDIITGSKLDADTKATMLRRLASPGLTAGQLSTLSTQFETAAGRTSEEGIKTKESADAKALTELNRREDKKAADTEKEAAKDQEPIIAFDPKTKRARLYDAGGSKGRWLYDDRRQGRDGSGCRQRRGCDKAVQRRADERLEI